MKIWGWTSNPGEYGWPGIVQRARDARLDGIIIKWGSAGNDELPPIASQAGAAWGAENYVYPADIGAEAARLAHAVDAGASFAVMNAELEWEQTAPTRRTACSKRVEPDIRMFLSIACTDMRSSRRGLPHHPEFVGYFDALAADGLSPRLRAKRCDKPV